MDPVVQIKILESRVESLTAVNSKLHDMIKGQIALIHDLQIQLAESLG